MANTAEVLTVKTADGLEIDIDPSLLTDELKKKLNSDRVISLPRIKFSVLAKIIEWDNRHKYFSESRDDVITADIDDEINELQKWEKDFFEKNQKILLGILIAANELNIEDLVEVGCQNMANVIIKEYPKEIKTLFNLIKEVVAEKNQKIDENL